MSPQVTVVISTYNRADLLPRAIASVLAQTMRDLELVVVDDGSSDATLSALDGITDRRVRVVARPHTGVAASRNAALAVARAPWVAFLDDDNEWKPTYLEHQLAVADTTPEAGVVYCVGELPGDERGVWPRRTPCGAVFADLCTPWGPLVSATLIRRDLLVELGGFATSLQVFEDRDLFLRLSLNTSYASSQDPLVVRHDHNRPRLILDEDVRMRAIVELDRRWRLTVLRRAGLRGVDRWTTHWWVEPHLAVMYRHADVDGRRAAWPTIRHLLPRLPWSASGIVRALVLLAFGPSRGARFRAAALAPAKE